MGYMSRAERPIAGEMSHPRVTHRIVGKAVTVTGGEERPRLRDRMRRWRNAWPRGDDLDKRIISLTIPGILNLMLLPLVGLVDTYWVGRLGNAVSLAGMGAANQVFTTTAWAVSFLPSVTTPLVAKAVASGNKDEAAKRIAESMVVATTVGVLAMTFLQTQPLLALSMVAGQDAQFRDAAQSYLQIRSLSIIPALVSTVAFSAFRGKLDTTTPLKVSLFSNVLNCALDPILMFKCGLGVVGAAAATVVAEFFSAAVFLTLMLKQQMVKMKQMLRLPKWEALKPLLKGGLAVQMRSLVMNVALLSATKSAAALDPGGVNAAAYQLTVIFWQLGATVMLALSTTSGILVPSQMGKGGANKEERVNGARNVADRMLTWGAVSGFILGAAQFLCIPLIGKFSAVEAVNEAARGPAALVAASQFLNGIVFAGEGIMQGLECYRGLAALSAIAAVFFLSSLEIVKSLGLGLNGVWISFLLFNGVRLVGVLLHRYKIGPLARRASQNVGDGDAHNTSDGENNKTPAPAAAGN